MRIVATIEARMASTRLRGKVLLPIHGKAALHMMIERVKKARYIDDIVVATTTNPEDGQIEALCKILNVGCYRGSEEDVLSRVLEAAKANKADLICELTGDSPLIDPVLIDSVITTHLSGSHDYTSNCLNQQTFPIGVSVQVFSVSALERAAKLTSDPIDRVHVSCFIYHNPRIFKLKGVVADAESFGPDIRITLDTQEDYALIRNIFDALYKNGEVFLTKDVVKYMRSNPDLFGINRHIRQKSIDEG